MQRRKKNTKGEIFEKRKKCHDNIKVTIEDNPARFLDTEIVRHSSAIITKVHTRSKMFPVHWSSKIHLRYKRNAIARELHGANKIASNFNNELKREKIMYFTNRIPNSCYN